MDLEENDGRKSCRHQFQNLACFFLVQWENCNWLLGAFKKKRLLTFGQNVVTPDIPPPQRSACNWCSVLLHSRLHRRFIFLKIILTSKHQKSSSSMIQHGMQWRFPLWLCVEGTGTILTSRVRLQKYILPEALRDDKSYF